MQQKLCDVIDDTISQIRMHGLKEVSVLDYQKCLFNPILKYFNQKGCEYYSKDLLYDFLDFYAERKEKGEIGDSFYSRFQKAVCLLISTAETGYTDFSVRKSPRVYSPTPEHMKIIDDILDSAHCTDASRKDLLPPMKHFFCYIEACGLNTNSIVDNTVLSFYNEASVTKKASMKRVLRVIRLITEYLKKNTSSHLYMDYSMLSVKKSRERCIAPYSLNEVNAILSVIDKSTKIGTRDYAIILLALGTGLRGCDIVSLCLKDIDWNKKCISVMQRKTGDFLQLPLGNDVMNAMADYILKFRPDTGENYVFLTVDFPPRQMHRCTPYKRLKRYKAMANISSKERQGFHSLRRTFATELSSCGVSLPVISSMMGHKGIDEDRPYLSYDNKKLSFVAMDFSDVPLAGNYYSDCNLSPKETKEVEPDGIL